MKKIYLFIIFILSFSLVGCNKLSDPNTNLEFWIKEKVDDVDFSNYQMKYGMFGGNQYYGTGYIPIVDENNQQIDPDEYVIYTVTAYPDYASNSIYVTRIEIKDPSIEFYGLSLNSDVDEIKDTMGDMGFSFEELNNNIIAKKGKYTFNFSSSYIFISVNVTNITGIVF